MLQIGPLIIDFTPFLEAALRSPWYGAWYVTAHGGWAVFLLIFFVGFKWLWLKHIALKISDSWKWVLLAVDVPAENIQSPKAVENIMAHLAGAHKTSNLIEKYITGFAQPYFSLEIASINGFVRFYIYTTVANRDLVEAAIYAQYPSAEIAEEDDYTKDAPAIFPDPEINLWGVEFILAGKQAYPIRTWEDFHDETSEEAKYKDPMAALLETMSSLREGEQLWFQIIITPIKSKSWQDASYREVHRIAGIKSKEKKTWLTKLMGLPSDLMIAIVDLMMPGTPASDKKGKEDLPSQMLYLTPGERAGLEAIEDKAAKIGFHTKIRALYLGRKEVFHKPRAAYGIIGAIKQVNTEDMNSLKPEFKHIGTGAKYLWKDRRNNWRRRKLMRAYKARSNWRGHQGYVMNIEELATLWHFPISESVKAPLVKQAESKRAAPPYDIPTPGSPFHRAKAKIAPVEEGDVPRNLPIG